MAFNLDEFSSEFEDSVPDESSEVDNENEVEDTETELEAQSDEELELDNYMNEVDERLEVASYYKALLKNPLFGTGNRGKASFVVEKEVRTFCRQRLAVLMGMVQEKPPTPVPITSRFTTEQEDILIGIANTLIARNKGVVPGPPKVTPAVVGNIPVTQVKTVPTVSVPVQTPPKAKPGPKPKAKVAPKTKSSAKEPPKPVFINKPSGEFNEKGEEIVNKLSLIQKPAGMVPFPANFEAASAALAHSAVQKTEAMANGLVGRIGSQIINE